MVKTVIVDGARTAFGKLGGSLSSLSASDLGGKVIAEAMQRAGVEGKDIGEVIMGSVLQGGQGQLPSRQAARNANIPWHVKTETVNKVCASGMRSVTMGDQFIRLGEEEIIVAGGMESMSSAPYFLPKARFGYRMGDGAVKDMMLHDGLTCSFEGIHMGSYGNRTANKHDISREAQDEWAARSHELAGKAIESGVMKEEIVPVEVPQRKGDPISVDTDEAPRLDTTAEKLKKLKPAFDPDGSITAGNAPGVNDGACAMVLMSDEKAKQQNVKPLATIIAHDEIAVEAQDFPETPGLVINKILEKTGKKMEDIDLFEVNEAFAVVSLAGGKIAGLDTDKVNVNGGAVALGHPIGASGARIILTLAYELRRRGGGTGIAAICSGGGQGDAVMIEVEGA
ncbi:acetyl-CoA acetyltransferase [Salimicrobium jeotgali]|uniref:acetyl-CoA C-acetyltransferase n=1 Tax=Salimicrobium jeotgali TaxID=1230341 RepID=K2GAQ2_9BACI|nr:acetyl-CoA C-acetyltransferase [Salimicrobium jeotgali]AKG03706.1 acetyl-CoA acetyltransferase [Salimicrobium jeotgali]EKE31442.1 acetyl-CoA acetyltransferase [Salimicrobium jeotgali]MBM7697052.1 acetyl-CoA C-acetyltransferase [Salimicrobium jeotgali]